MASIESVLRKPRLTEEAKIRQCRTIVGTNENAFGTLLDTVMHPDPSVRVLAAKVVNAVSAQHPNLTDNFKNIIIYKISKVDQNDVRREIIHVLPRLNLTEREYVDVGHIINDYFYSADKNIIALCLHTVDVMLSRDYDRESPLSKRFLDMLDGFKRRYASMAPATPVAAPSPATTATVSDYTAQDQRSGPAHLFEDEDV